MRPPQLKIMKKILTSIICLFFVACAAMTPQQQAIATTATNLARIAVEAAATFYGGPGAGIAAAKGLDAVAAVIQGYVGNTIPPAVIKASPGVEGVGRAIVPLIAPDHVVSQADVDKVARAAEIAKTISPAIVTPQSP